MSMFKMQHQHHQPTTIQDLPELPMLSVFSHLSYQEVLLSVQLVCTGWQSLALESVRSRERLTILCGQPSMDPAIGHMIDNQFVRHFADHEVEERLHLPLGLLSPTVTRTVVSHFPRLRSLVICVPCMASLLTTAFIQDLLDCSYLDDKDDNEEQEQGEHKVILRSQWSRTLTEVKIQFGSRFLPFGSMSDGWCRTCDSYWVVSHGRRCYPLPGAVDLYHRRMVSILDLLACRTRFPALSARDLWYGGEVLHFMSHDHLRAFTSSNNYLKLETGDQLDPFVSSLLELDETPAKAVRLRNLWSSTNPIYEWATLDRLFTEPTVAMHLTRLVLSGGADIVARIDQLNGQHCHSLTELRVGWMPSRKLANLSQGLSTFPSQFRLMLYLDLEPAHHQSHQMMVELSPLPSITALWLFVRLTTPQHTHQAFERRCISLPLRAIFPSVQEVRLQCMACLRCQYPVLLFEQLTNDPRTRQDLTVSPTPQTHIVANSTEQSKVANCEFELCTSLVRNVFPPPVAVGTARRYHFTHLVGFGEDEATNAMVIPLPPRILMEPPM